MDFRAPSAGFAEPGFRAGIKEETAAVFSEEGPNPFPGKDALASRGFWRVRCLALEKRKREKEKNRSEVLQRRAFSDILALAIYRDGNLAGSTFAGSAGKRGNSLIPKGEAAGSSPD